MSDKPSRLKISSSLRKSNEEKESRLKGSLVDSFREKGSGDVARAIDSRADVLFEHPTLGLEILHIDHGEDARPLTARIETSTGEIIKICFVADGLGGAGAAKYRIDDVVKTGAQIASETARSAVEEWIQDEDNFSGSTENIKQGLERVLRAHFSSLEDKFAEYIIPSRVRGTLTKKFPTTFTVVLSTESGDQTRVQSFSVGDSPVSVLADGVLYTNADDDTGDAVMGTTIVHVDDDGSPVVNLEAKEKTFSSGTPIAIIASSDGIDKRLTGHKFAQAVQGAGSAATIVDQIKTAWSKGSEVDDATLAVATTEGYVAGGEIVLGVW